MVRSPSLPCPTYISTHALLPSWKRSFPLESIFQTSSAVCLFIPFFLWFFRFTSNGLLFIVSTLISFLLKTDCLSLLFGWRMSAQPPATLMLICDDTTLEMLSEPLFRICDEGFTILVAHPGRKPVSADLWKTFLSVVSRDWIWESFLGGFPLSLSLSLSDCSNSVFESVFFSPQLIQVLQMIKTRLLSTSVGKWVTFLAKCANFLALALKISPLISVVMNI